MVYVKVLLVNSNVLKKKYLSAELKVLACDKCVEQSDKKNFTSTYIIQQML